MRFEPKLAEMNESSEPIQPELDLPEFDALPDDFAELATQLSADAAMLARRYPANERDRRQRPAKRRPWSPLWVRAAAVLLVAAGATIGASVQYALDDRPGLVTEAPSATVDLDTVLAEFFPVSAPAEPAVELPEVPAFVATEAVEQLNGEDIEALADALEGQLAEI